MPTCTTTADSQVCLSSLKDRPDADVVIYDGQCAFCTGQVERLARWDRRGRLSFLSLHDPIVAERYPDLTREQLMDQMYVIDQVGQRHGGAAAFRYLSRKLPRLWLLGPIMHIPFSLPLWQWCYRQVAKRRYRIAGKEACDGDACDVHFK
ncbi:MAG: thiol-disulfide oxidoreductase [Planctomycetaceae bacterium]|nr:thiol-disulfide oxidoreductase [Planctomycetaceae bacterium]